jgi:hypothetical protein
MSSSDLIRWGGIAAMAAGVVWIISGILAIVYQGVHAPGTFADYLVEGTFAVGLVLTVVGMVGLHTLQKENYGRIGRAGFYTVVVASLGQVLGTVVLLAGSAALAWLVFPVGVLAVLVGFVLYGAATLRARVLPRWCGVGLIVGLPVAIALGLYGGNILFGLLWLALGYVLWSRREAATAQPLRVS